MVRQFILRELRNPFITIILLIGICASSAFGFVLSLFLRPFHPWSINVTQLWLAWVGLRIRTVDPLPQSLPQSQAARLRNYVILLPPLLRPRPLRHLWKPILPPTTSELRPKPIILSPRTSWCTFPDRAKSYLQLLPSLSLLITSGPPDPLQDHYALQQYQGSIYSLKRFPPRGSPNVVILNTTSTVFLAIGSGPYALRIIGAITLRFL